MAETNNFQDLMTGADRHVVQTLETRARRCFTGATTSLET
jgi:hypothetical protein